MQVQNAVEIDVRLCQSLVNFLKSGKFEVNAVTSHDLSNTVRWVTALANSVAISFDEGRKEKAEKQPKAGQPSGFKVKSIHQGETPK